jgi:Ni2+-binding GTPase involved in maturation of urease and hydrogenase
LKTKVILINGALGSGKTTILKQLLADARYGSSLVIENEIADQDFDSGTLGDNVVESIAGSCVCCASPADLVTIFNKLRAVQPDRTIILESTGAASALQLVANLLMQKDFTSNFTIQAIIYVIDTFRVAEIDKFAIDAQLADLIVVTKRDLQEAADYDALDRLGPYIVKSGISDQAFIDTIPEESRSADVLPTLVKNFVSTKHEPNVKVIRLDNLTLNTDADIIFQKQKSLGIKRLKGRLSLPSGHVEYDATYHAFEVRKISQRPEQCFLVAIDAHKDNLTEFESWIKNL